MLNFNKAKIGKFYTIVKINEYAPEKIARRLYDLGFTSGQKIRFYRKSLLGKVILVELRGYTLSLRETVAQYIMVDSGVSK